MKGDRSDEELDLLAELRKERMSEVPSRGRIQEIREQLKQRYHKTTWSAGLVIKSSLAPDPGGRSRSPSFGRWPSDDQPD